RAEPVGEHASRRPRADNDVIELRHRPARFPPGKVRDGIRHIKKRTPRSVLCWRAPIDGLNQASPPMTDATAARPHDLPPMTDATAARPHDLLTPTAPIVREQWYVAAFADELGAAPL